MLLAPSRALLFLSLLGGAATAAPAPPRLLASAETVGHRIQPGDTLIGLHRQLMRPEADWRVVQRLNRVADPRRLQPGQTLQIPVSFLQGEPVAAEVVHVHGQVSRRRGSEAPQPLTATADLREGDVVETGAQSSLSIRFVDGALTLVGPSSRVQVTRHRQWPGRGDASPATATGRTELDLQQGATETDVPPRPGSDARVPRFELRTPVVNFGVRGTRFRARVEGATAWGEVERGSVAAGPLLLAAGQGARAGDGQPLRARPLLPPPSADGLPGRMERLPLQWRWSATAEAQGWRAQILQLPEPGSAGAAVAGPTVAGLVHEAVVRAPALALADLPDGHYELRLRALDADGLEGREQRVPFVLKARPEPPLAVSPAADSVWTTPSVALAWSRHPQGERYRLEVWAETGEAAGTPLVAREDLTETRLDLPLPPGRYRWRVGTIRAGNDAGPWGDFQTFERRPPPPPPPAPASEPPRAERGALQLRWAAAATPAARYQVQVARDEAFAAPVADETLDVTAWTLTDPPPGRLHVRVRAFDDQGQAGPWGVTQTVDVPRAWEWWWFLPLLLLI
ncbi:MAG: FecR domain-containing protein [Rubrivivax sp.]